MECAFFLLLCAIYLKDLIPSVSLAAFIGGAILGFLNIAIIGSISIYTDFIK